MRLTGLDPRFFARDGRTGEGMAFLCPHCKKDILIVTFANPIDGGEPFPLNKFDLLFGVLKHIYKQEELGLVVPPGCHWTRKGESFESMTISPSVDASKSGNWHGFITDGVIS
jgi:hypothetical protein